MKTFIFDFDGTITKEDTTDVILGSIPDAKQIWQLEEDWKSGRITSYQCMKAQTRFLKGTTLEKVNQNLKQNSHMDVNFPKLVQFLKATDFHIVVLSEGYDISIKFHHINEYVKEIHCSELLVRNGKLTGGLKVLNEKRWNYNEKCIGCCICKVDFLQRLKKEFKIDKIVAVGDGLSDECLFHHVDISFSLNPKIKADHQVKDLGDVLKILEKQG